MKLVTGIATVSLGAMAMAQSTSTVVEIYKDSRSPNILEDMFASVVDSNDKATTYQLQCPSSATLPFCPLPTPGTYIYGPSTADLNIVYTESLENKHFTYTSKYQCEITPSVIATCHQHQVRSYSVVSQTVAPSSSIKTADAATNDFSNTASSGSVYTGSMTVTAGLDKLSGSKTTGTPKTSNTATETSSGMGAAVTAGKGSGMGIAAAAGVAAVAVLL